MFGFFKNLVNDAKSLFTSKSESDPTEVDTSVQETADTFVEATGGGWGEPPVVVSAEGGTQSNYVKEQLEAAHQQALSKGLKVGDTLEFKMTKIPKGILSPHEIAFGFLMQATNYGFKPGLLKNETVELLVDRDPREV